MPISNRLPNISRVVNYLRRSRQDLERERRTGEDTLSTQRKIMAKVLDELGLPYDVHSEIGSGDKIETRPVFQEVLQQLEMDTYNAIAVKEIARLGRGSYSDMGRIFDLIDRKQIFIITPYKIYDIRNPADARQIRFELFFAREEFENIRERMLSSKLSIAFEGRWVVGAPPFGYTLNHATAKLEIDPAAATIVKMIYQLYAYGLPQADGTVRDVGLSALAGYLNNHGIPTPRKAKGWRYLSLQRLLTNVVYKGTFQYRRRRRIGNTYQERPVSEWITVPNAHEPIINKELWELAQEKHNRRNRPRVKAHFSPCELAGLFVCVKCARKMVRQCSTQRYQKKDGSISIYKKEFLWCTTKGCTFVKYRDAEEELLNVLDHLAAINPTKLAATYQERKKQLLADSHTDNLKAMTTKKKLELKRKLAFLMEKYENGFYDDEEYWERKEIYRKELAVLEESNAEEEPADREISPAVAAELDFNTISKGPLSIYKKLPLKTQKNALLHSLVEKVELTKLSKGEYQLDVYPRLTLK